MSGDDLLLSPAVRLHPPSTGRDGWIALHLISHRRYELSLPEAIALLAPSRADAELLAEMRKRSLLIDRTDNRPDIEWLCQLRRSWQTRGWDQAADYRLFVFDGPLQEVRNGPATVPHQEPQRQRSNEARLTGADVTCIIANSLQDGVNAYVVPLELEDLGSGTFCVVNGSSNSPRLHAFNLGVVDHATATEVFAHSLGRSPFPFPIAAVLVLTTVFADYANDATEAFGVAHIDIGRVAARISNAARVHDIPFGLIYCDPAVPVEELLGLDGADEGYMCTIALGHGSAARAKRRMPGAA